MSRAFSLKFVFSLPGRSQLLLQTFLKLGSCLRHRACDVYTEAPERVIFSSRPASIGQDPFNYRQQFKISRSQPVFLLHEHSPLFG